MIRKRKDKNQRDIIKALKQIGCKVYDLSNVGEGVPDLLIGCKYLTILAECKNKENWYGKKEAHYTTQKTFRETWNGGLVLTFYSPEDALHKITKEIERGIEAIQKIDMMLQLSQK